MTTTATRRRIPGTDSYAITVYRSKDGSVVDVRIVDAAGNHLGRVSLHSARLGLSRGWHEGNGAYSHRLRCWATLSEAARTFETEREAS